MKKVICIGECLIDFVPESQGMTYTAKAGGAPCNVCACVAKLGGNGYYLGKIGTDVFARFLLQNMNSWHIKTDYVTISDYPTALAFVTLDEHGDREFSFYRTQSADLMLDESDIPHDFIGQGDILHFCSVGLVESPSKYAHIKAISEATACGAIVSFDVNIREKLWSSIGECVATIKEFLPFAHIVKVTDD